MNTSLKSAGALLFAATVAIAGCSGSSGDPGPAGTDGKNGTPAVSTGLKIEVTKVTVNSDKTVSVRFTLKDDGGYPVDKSAVFTPSSTGNVAGPSFALAYFTKDSNGKVLPYKVLTQTRKDAASAFSPSTYNPTQGRGTILENGSGDYTYTFPGAAGDTTQAVVLDSTKLSSTHTIWIQAARQTNASDRRTITPVNFEFNFVPSGGTPEKREVASTAGCNKCHDGFKKYKVETGGFHGGGRIEAPFCGICHNPERQSGRDESGIPAAEAGRFVHRIHFGEELRKVTTGTSTVGYQDKIGVSPPPACTTSAPCTCTATEPCRPTAFHGIDEVTYPQDIRNCKACHEGAAQGDQWNTRPNRAACGSCHDYVNFVDGTMTKCNATADKSGGCSHSGGPQTTDGACTTCHNSDSVKGYHVPVLAKDPNNSLDGGSNIRTNAGAIAAAGVLPPGASQITYELKSVGTWDDGGVKRPTMTFRFLRDGQPVVFKAPGGELMDDFVGSSQAYFAWSVPQDGIAAPADFNATQGSSIKALRNGTATGSAAGTCEEGTGADAGYYVVKLTAATVAANAKLLTGGIGYAYDLPGNQPLTQINGPGSFNTTYPYDPAKGSGGLIVPARNVSKPATGSTGRRAIVSNDKCNNCHVFLGVAPSFHVGQRNDGPTCAFCHNPNRTSSGWSANASTFIHGIHGTDKRTVPFNWHATSATEGFWDVTFPGYLADCQTCHFPGTYDFSATASAAAVPNLLWSTVGTGTYSASFSLSPYVATGTNYGSGFSYNTGTDVTTPAAGTTLVTSPITAACFACHDTDMDRYHMIGNGGALYAPRSSVTSGGKLVNTEQCLICHGTGKIADIGEVHW